MKNQIKQSVEYLEISAEQAGQRVDNFLLCYLKGVPRSLVYRIVRRGEVRINKGRIKPTYKLQAGDILRVPPITKSEPRDPNTPSKSALERIKSSVMFEDNRLMVINKPSGMAVHGGSGLSDAVIETLRYWRSELHYMELVHRLDRETSGCLLIAKKRSALRQLHELLRESKIKKTYIALVKGQWQGGKQKIDVPLLRNQLQSGERMVTVSEEGKRAVSYFKPIKVSKQYSLIEVTIETGRTHQIRVHAAHIGYPIVGDQKYGDESFNKMMRTRKLNRMFLHARKLEFSLSEPEQKYVFEAPPDDQLEQIFKEMNHE